MADQALRGSRLWEALRNQSLWFKAKSLPSPLCPIWSAYCYGWGKLRYLVGARYRRSWLLGFFSSSSGGMVRSGLYSSQLGSGCRSLSHRLKLVISPSNRILGRSRPISVNLGRSLLFSGLLGACFLAQPARAAFDGAYTGGPLNLGQPTEDSYDWATQVNENFRVINSSFSQILSAGTTFWNGGTVTNTTTFLSSVTILGSICAVGPKPTIDVDCLGAVADGNRDLQTGTDNRSIIQAAIDALPPNGGEIFYSSASYYRVHGPLYWPGRKFISFRGVRQPNDNGDFGTTLLFTSTTLYGIFIGTATVPSKNASFFNIGLEGSTNTAYGVYISSGADGNFIARDFSVGGFREANIYFDSSGGASASTSNNTLDHVISSRSKYCLRLDGATSATNISSSRMQKCSVANAAHTGTPSVGSINFFGGDYSHYGSTDAPAILLENVTAGNIIGVYIEAVVAARNTDIITVRGNALTGGLSRGIKIDGNTIGAGDQVSGTGHIIGIYESSGVVVGGNSFNCGSNKSPLRSDYASTNLDWLANSYGDNCTTPPGWHGNNGRVFWKDGSVTIGTTPSTTNAWFKIYAANQPAGRGAVEINGNPGETALFVNNTTSSANGFAVRSGTSATHINTRIEDFNGTPALEIRGNKFIGIGTYTPATRLHLSTGTLTIDGDTGPAMVTVSSVGIGISTPSAMLEVRGDIALSIGATRTIYVASRTALGNALVVRGADSSGANGGDTIITSGDALNGIDQSGDVYLYSADSQSDGDVIIGHTGGAIRGNTCIGCNSPVNTLDVGRGMVVGSAYAGSVTAPANGLAVSGRIGTNARSAATQLDVGGNAQFGAAVRKSTFTNSADLVMASGSSVTLSGPNGRFTSGSSVTASAFFGDGSNLTGISASESNTFTSSKTFTNAVKINGQLLVGSTLTVTGNAFSVGGSSFTVFGGSATVAYSLTAGSFVGNGALLTNLPSAEGNTFTSSKTFTQDVLVASPAKLSVTSVTVTYGITAGTATFSGNVIGGGSFNEFGNSGVTSATNSENLGVHRDGQAGFTVSSIGDSALLSAVSARGSHASKTTIFAGDTLASLRSRGYVGSSGYVSGAQIDFISTGTVSDASNGLGAYIQFYTRAHGANLLPRMVLSDDGYLGLGTGNKPASLIHLASGTLTINGNASQSLIANASVTASAFFGYGGNLTGINATESNTYTSSKTFTSTVTVGYAITSTTLNYTSVWLNGYTVVASTTVSLSGGVSFYGLDTFYDHYITLTSTSDGSGPIGIRFGNSGGTAHSWVSNSNCATNGPGSGAGASTFAAFFTPNNEPFAGQPADFEIRFSGFKSGGGTYYVRGFQHASYDGPFGTTDTCSETGAFKYSSSSPITTFLIYPPCEGACSTIKFSGKIKVVAAIPAVRPLN